MSKYCFPAALLRLAIPFKQACVPIRLLIRKLHISISKLQEMMQYPKSKKNHSPHK